jgi:peptidoglycan/LPS O-acetylase OafA/YrhL
LAFRDSAFGSRNAAPAAGDTVDRASSERIDALRFPLIVGVVFIHAYAVTGRIDARASDVVEFIRDFVSNGLAATAVPLFFFLSAFLFFRGGRWSREIYAAKLATRVRTLLVPYVAWNLLDLAAIVVAQSIPETARYFHAGYVPVTSMPLPTMLDTALGITGAPIAYPFWFIKDLMVLVALAPLVHAGVARAGGALLAVLGAAWMVNLAPAHVLDLEAACFFCAGAYVAVHRHSPFALDRYGRMIACAYLALVTADAWSGKAMEDTLLHNVGVVVGCAAVLWASRVLARRGGGVLRWLGGASFFVFAAHEPLLTVVGKLLASALEPHTPPQVLALYLVVPLVVVSSCLALYALVRRLPMAVQSVLTGGRGRPRRDARAHPVAQAAPVDPV